MSFEKNENDNHAESIIEIGSGQFITEGTDGSLCLGDKEARLLFYDETDAENTLLMLNEEHDGCYALVDELCPGHECNEEQSDGDMTMQM